MKQYLNRKACIIGLAKDGKSYQEIAATINMLYDQEGFTTAAVRFVKKYQWSMLSFFNFVIF